MNDTPRYWFGTKNGFGYGLPLRRRGWLATAVWMTVWLAATPFVNSRQHPFQSRGFWFGCIGVMLGLAKWKGEP